jgi:dTMP kinase
MFVTFEGGDGCGKSTQAEQVRKHLEATGREVLRTREPGGTELGVTIRQIVLHSKEYIDPNAEVLLFAADRAHHINTLVAPALRAGTDVVQDRYLDSSVAYQGAGRLLSPREIRDISMWAAGGLLPDLTVLLDLSPELAAERVASQNKSFDRLEAEEDDFRERLREEFLAIAKREPSRFLVVDASLPQAEITALIVAEIDRRRRAADAEFAALLASEVEAA